MKEKISQSIDNKKILPAMIEALSEELRIAGIVEEVNTDVEKAVKAVHIIGFMVLAADEISSVCNYAIEPMDIVSKMLSVYDDSFNM